MKLIIKQKLFEILIVITILACFVFVNKAAATTYYSSGTLISKNLLSGQTVNSIEYFGYNSSLPSASTTLKAQFSQDNTNWYNATHTADSWSVLSDGNNLATSSALELTSWSAESNFYYKILFETSDTSTTAILYEIKLHYNLGSYPTVTTQAVTNINQTTSTASGNITDIGGSNPTVRGFKYGLTQTDTWDVNEAGSFGTGSYSLTLTGLVPNKTHYVRAYATNSKGTSYGSWQSFTTKPYYYSSGTLVSKNLFSGSETVVSINSFYTSSTIPSNTNLWVQFSTTSNAWYNAAGTLNGTTTISTGEATTSLAILDWSGTNLYYKIQFETTDNTTTSILYDISLDYTSNLAPNTPTSLTQYKLDCSTQISTSTIWTNETQVCIKGNISDPDAPDQVKLQIELVTSTDSFTNSPTHSASTYCASTCTSEVNITGLIHGAQYKWQTRSIDDDSATSNFIQFNSGNIALGVDTATPTSFSIASITADSVSQLTVTATATDPTSGLHSTPFWFREASGNSGASSSTDWQTSNNFIDTGLSANIQYTYQTKARDVANNQSSYSTSSSKYTLSPTPTNFTRTFIQSAISFSVDSFPNDNSGASSYYFWREGNNSGWVQKNNWQDTGFSCNTSYTWQVKYRNGDGTETGSTSLTGSTEVCLGSNISFFSSSAIIDTKEKPIIKITIEELKQKITEILTKIAQLKIQIQQLSEKEIPTDYQFSVSLRYGQENNSVKYLQIFLKNQGSEIYPEGITSGWFGPLTKKAVIRFQEKYVSDILFPWELTEGTGFVGKTTLDKINEIF